MNPPPTRAAAGVAAALACALAACSGPQVTAPPGVPPPAPSPLSASQVTVQTLRLPEHPGLSGVAERGDGFAYAVPERVHALLRLTLGPEDPALRAEIAIPDVPSGIDLESLAFVGEDRLAFGTESQSPYRSADPILFYRLAGDTLRADGQLELPYGLWDTKGASNEGIEGLCHAGATLIAGVETAQEATAGQRYALLAARPDGGDAWRAHRLWLSTQTGKLSSLDCWEAGGEISVLAIERHYGVARILAFTLPEDGAVDIVPEVLADLSLAADPLPNLEGLLRQGDGALVLLSDNSHEDPADTAQIWRVPPTPNTGD